MWRHRNGVRALSITRVIRVCIIGNVIIVVELTNMNIYIYMSVVTVMTVIVFTVYVVYSNWCNILLSYL
jgi:hypothetical protein